MLEFILKKLISSEENQPQPQSDNNIDRRQYDRYEMNTTPVSAAGEGEVLIIREMSLKGFSAYIPEEAFKNLSVNDCYRVLMRIGKHVQKLKAKVSWKAGKSLVGFELVDLDKQSVDIIQKIVKPVAIAKSLNLVTGNLNQDDHGEKIWFHGDEDTDLFAWHTGDGRMNAWQLIFSDRFICWHSEVGLRTGTLQVAQSESDKLVELSRDNLVQQFDQMPDQETLSFAVNLLKATNLDIKEQILAEMYEVARGA